MSGAQHSSIHEVSVPRSTSAIPRLVFKRLPSSKPNCTSTSQPLSHALTVETNRLCRVQDGVYCGPGSCPPQHPGENPDLTGGYSLCHEEQVSYCGYFFNWARADCCSRAYCVRSSTSRVNVVWEIRCSRRFLYLVYINIKCFLGVLAKPNTMVCHAGTVPNQRRSPPAPAPPPKKNGPPRLHGITGSSTFVHTRSNVSALCRTRTSLCPMWKSLASNARCVGLQSLFVF